jgi:hypothetical protein
VSAERRGFLQRLTDWFFVIEEPAEPAEPAPVDVPAEAPAAPARAEPAVEPTPEQPQHDLLPRRAAARAPQPRRERSGAAWLVVVLALAVAAVAVYRGFPRAPSSVASLSATGQATPTATATETAAQIAAAVAQAKTAAGNASRAAQDAITQAQHVADLLAAAQEDAQAVQTAATPMLARQADARDPSGALGPLEQADSDATRTVTTIESDATAADGSANAAASIAQTVAGAVPAGDAAATAAQQANQALASAQQAAGQISDLLATAQAAVAQWKQIHGAPHGVLGVTVQDPSPSLGAQGCEVVDVQADGAGAQAGLIGADQRPSNVGDIITELSDPAAAAKPFTITSCAVLRAAMTLTRSGDRLDITYLSQQVVVAAAQWVRETGTAVLGATAAAGGGSGGAATATASGSAGSATGTATASGSGTATGTATASGSCPAPITGTITPASAGSRIALFIALSGPGGQAPNLRAILDTGGVATSFPDGLLRQLGYQPYGTTENQGVVPGATATAYLYHVPGSAITVLDGGHAVPLATGVLNVIGIPGSSNYTLGPDILEGGSKLSTSGSEWTLTPPC